MTKRLLPRGQRRKRAVGFVCSRPHRRKGDNHERTSASGAGRLRVRGGRTFGLRTDCNRGRTSHRHVHRRLQAGRRRVCWGARRGARPHSCPDGDAQIRVSARAERLRRSSVADGGRRSRAGLEGCVRRARPARPCGRNGAPTDVGARPRRPARPAAGQDVHLQPDRPGVNAYIIDTGIRTTTASSAGARASAPTPSATATAPTTATATARTSRARSAARRSASRRASRSTPCACWTARGSGTTSGVIAGIDWVTANHARRRSPT